MFNDIMAQQHCRKVGRGGGWQMGFQISGVAQNAICIWTAKIIHIISNVQDNIGDNVGWYLFSRKLLRPAWGVPAP